MVSSGSNGYKGFQMIQSFLLVDQGLYTQIISILRDFFAITELENFQKKLWFIIYYILYYIIYKIDRGYIYHYKTFEKFHFFLRSGTKLNHRVPFRPHSRIQGLP